MKTRSPIDDSRRDAMARAALLLADTSWADPVDKLIAKQLEALRHRVKRFYRNNPRPTATRADRFWWRITKDLPPVIDAAWWRSGDRFIESLKNPAPKRRPGRPRKRKFRFAKVPRGRRPVYTYNLPAIEAEVRAFINSAELVGRRLPLRTALVEVLAVALKQHPTKHRKFEERLVLYEESLGSEQRARLAAVKYVEGSGFDALVRRLSRVIKKQYRGK